MNTLNHASDCDVYAIVGASCSCPVAEVARLKVRIAELQAELVAARPAQPQTQLVVFTCSACGQREPPGAVLQAVEVVHCGVRHVLEGGRFVARGRS